MTEPPAARLREIARSLERLPPTHRLSPEDLVVARLAMAAELRRLAADLERSTGIRRPSERRS